MTLDADPDRYRLFSRRWWRAYWRMLDERARLIRRRRRQLQEQRRWQLLLMIMWMRLGEACAELAATLLAPLFREAPPRNGYEAPPAPPVAPAEPAREIAPSALGQLKEALDFLRYRTGRTQRAEPPPLRRLPAEIAQFLDAAIPAAKGRMRDEAEAVYRTGGEAAARQLLDYWRAAAQPQDVPPAGGAQGIDHRPRRDPDDDEPGHRPAR